MKKTTMKFSVRKFGCEPYIICPTLEALHSLPNPQFSHQKS